MLVVRHILSKIGNKHWIISERGPLDSCTRGFLSKMVLHPFTLEWSSSLQKALSTHAESPTQICIFPLEYEHSESTRHLRKASNMNDSNKYQIKQTLKKTQKAKNQNRWHRPKSEYEDERALKPLEVGYCIHEKSTGCTKAKRNNQRIRKSSWELQMQ